jgi:L-seryl-tRNA(Ser) seleniumtransferase
VSYRLIPSIEQLRQRAEVRELEELFGRDSVVDALRLEAAAMRERLSAGETPPDIGGDIVRALPGRLRRTLHSLEGVINATGVIVHTNLGRAPLSRFAADRVAALGTGYTNLEYDLVREVLISRGELVEIGGGFRVPDVMAQSGAILREVGTTNRTRAADYAAALSERTAMILRVHPSNFRIEGFTERPELHELTALGRRFSVPVAEDLGSGYLGVPADVDALRDEPIVRTSLDAGADVVMFSGDKLLGGPQAGIIAGKEAALTPVRRHPLMRALRVDKMTYAALEGTLEAYASGRAVADVPVARMISMTAGEIDRRARAVAGALPRALQVAIVDGYSTIGGGSAPGSTLATRLIAVTDPDTSSDALAASLRAQSPPVIARIENDRVVLDLRTVAPEDDQRLATAIGAACAK